MTNLFCEYLNFDTLDRTSYKTRLISESTREFSFAATNGKRTKMEDFFIGGQDQFVFAIFDGANGTSSAKFAHHCVEKKWHKFTDAKTFDEDVNNLFLHMENEICAQDAKMSSTTALVADFIHENQVRIANLGDSRALLVRKDGTFRQITTDHHVSNEVEVAAAVARGGVFYRGRLDGVLLVTRSLGVPHYHASAVPDIHVVDLTDDDEWLILASDGIFEKLENERVAQLCVQNKAVAACSIVNEAISKGVDDNCTVLCILLPGL